MKAQHFSKDIQEFLSLLAIHEVKYVIVGGEAVIYHGHARLTGDVDFFFEPSEENSRRLYGALTQFWEGNVPGIESAEDLMEPGVIIQFGVPPNRMDLINSADGVTFHEVWQNRKTEKVEISGRVVPVHLMGMEDLIKNKEAVGRPKDHEDLKYLRKAKEEKPSI
jgi:hypothetical protein